MENLRSEALARQPEKLTSSQWDAALCLMQRLESQLQDIDRIGGKQPSVIDPNRKNRLLFWSGSPGVGKSSTYLSVRDWIEAGTKSDEQGAEEQTRIREVKERVGKIGHRVLWLETLDLEPLAGQPNFLAAVLARIGDSLTRRDSARPASDTPRDAALRDAHVALQRLETDIGLSWEGNLQARGGSLEPEVYAQEVMRAEHARLNVNLRFREVMGDLARYIPDRGRESGLFVLPVDDLYLKPNITIELLRFLRMISSPHLFVLVMGGMDVVQDLVFLHGIGEASQLMGSGGTILDLQSKERVVKSSSALASSSLEKLIPRSQRVVIDTMKPAEAIEYRPDGEPGPRLGWLLGLESVLKDAPIAGEAHSVRKPSPTKPESHKLIPDLKAVLASWIGAELTLTDSDTNPDPEGDRSLKRKVVVPWLLDAFQLSARNVADLYSQVHELAKALEESPYWESQKQKWRPAMIVTDQIERALFEHSELGHDKARSIVASWSGDFVYYERRFPESVKIVWGDHDGLWKTGVHSGLVQFAYDPKARLWEAGERKPGEWKPDDVPLSNLASAWFAILYDLLSWYRDLPEYPGGEDFGSVSLPKLRDGARTFQDLWFKCGPKWARTGGERRQKPVKPTGAKN